MNHVKALVGFVPFILFSLLAPLVGVGWAAAAGLVSAIVVIAATAQGGVKIPPVAQAVILLAMAIVGFAGDRTVDVELERFGPAIAALLLGLFMTATAATMPFTAQFARSAVPQRLWHDPRFLDANRRMSTVWGLAVLTMGLSHLVVASIGIADASLPVRLAANWVPTIVAFAVATQYTKRKQAAAAHAMEKWNAS